MTQLLLKGYNMELHNYLCFGFDFIKKKKKKWNFKRHNDTEIMDFE